MLTIYAPCVGQGSSMSSVTVTTVEGDVRGTQFFIENQPVNGFFGNCVI